MEFGSDFHKIDYPRGNSFTNQFTHTNFYTSGRQALIALAIARKWKRLWIPSYFCEESLNCFRQLDIELISYSCCPNDNPIKVIGSLYVQPSDGILVVNYFGLYGSLKFDTIAEIVEDHTHNVIGEWSRNSSADWCISSLRKTIPIPDGGVLWSPKRLTLPKVPITTEVVENNMAIRFNAMAKKKDYLTGNLTNKSEYLQIFSETEEQFDNTKLSGISNISSQILKDFDIVTWYSLKKRNYNVLKELVILPNSVKILMPQNEKDTPFSFCMMFPEKVYRDKVRRYLIDHNVYPAILWDIKSDIDKKAKKFGEKILSIHCDGRYSIEDMITLSSIINTSLKV